jgi:Gpi18-like mannosyltransferase
VKVDTVKTDTGALPQPSSAPAQPPERQRFLQVWWPACKQVFPLYVAIQIILLAISLYAPALMHLESQPVGWSVNSLSAIWRSWDRWDTLRYLTLAQNGYPAQYSSNVAFFPLFPLLIRGLSYLMPDQLTSGLLIARVAALVLLIVLYQFVKEEFGEKVSWYTLICLLVFPASTFLWAAYPESLFLCLTVLSFYAMYHRSWWLAGIFGLFACLARPNGIILLLPFCFEYLRQIQFRWQAIRWNALSAALLPLGVLLFSAFCYAQYGDLLAWEHAQSFWQRTTHVPWYALFRAIDIALMYPNYFQTLTSLSLNWFPDVLALVMTLVLIAFAVFARQRSGSHRWTYVLYAVSLWLFNNIDVSKYDPLLGTARNTLIMLPLFLMLGLLAERYRWFRTLYLPFSAALCLLWLVMFVTGYAGVA